MLAHMILIEQNLCDEYFLAIYKYVFFEILVNHFSVKIEFYFIFEN